MPNAENKALVARFLEEAVGRGDESLVDSLLADDFRLHPLWWDPRRNAEAASWDRNETKQAIATWRHAFPDLEVAIEHAVAENDRVGLHHVATGTFTNNVGPLHATRRRGAAAGMTLARVENGRIAEAWLSIDALGMLQQVRLAPPPEDFEGEPEDPERERRAGLAQPTVAVDGDPAPANRALLDRFWGELWNGNQLDVADEIVHPDFFDHGLVPHPTRYGPGGAKEAVSMFRTAIPDVELRVEDMVAEGDLVLTRWRGAGTQTGPLGTLKPKGKYAVVLGYTLNRVVDNRVVEAWDSFDLLGMLFQFGAIPPPDSLRARLFGLYMRLANTVRR